MALTTIQDSFGAGEISPSIFGRVDLAKWHQGAFTMRNFFVSYRGGASSRAGTAYVGMCKQGAPNPGGTSVNTGPPRDITFQFSNSQGYALEFGDSYMRIKSNGAYVTEAQNPITGITQASPGVFTYTNTHYSLSNGDWIYVVGVGGMTNFNGLVWIVQNLSGSTFTVTDLFGNAVNTTTFSAYTSGGTLARIYTVTSPYAAADLPYLKYTQSADVMSLTCVNQATNTDYAPYDLARSGATDWTFTAVTFASSISAPTGVTVTAQSSTTVTTYYSYVVTAVDASGQESVASSAGSVENNDISVYAGSNTVTWTAVGAATSYNIYKATPCYGAAVPAGVLYGFCGTSIGTSFVDSNIEADFTQVPPVQYNPFPSSGNYPGVVSYYQQRRVYASTLNDPDTYWMSQPGSFLNMDTATPVSDSDSITGTPWAQQVNGIQFMVPMPGGLVVLTGKGAWQLNGGSSAAITPADQDATPQAYNGCSSIVPPLTINYDILYVQEKGSIVRDLSYNFFVNIYTGTDMTVLSNHLFTDYQISQWAWAEEPYKIVWAVRNDGILLSFTYLKEQDVYAWARHDTNGLFVGVCSVTEPPVDAVYVIVQRQVRGKWVYYAERMNDRTWQNVEGAWCVDAGLQWPMNYPNATLTPASANGAGNITATNLIYGGSGYTSPIVNAVDPTGQGTGATFTVTVSAGVITAITPVATGKNYAPGTQLVIYDSTGAGAVAQPIITNDVTFTASSAVFSNTAGSGAAGDVIRVGGGKATVTSYVSTTQVIANITHAITETVPNDPNLTPIPAISGDWSIVAPTSSVTGLNHLEGLAVSILADGSVMPQQTVTNGGITLPEAYSAIVVGLPFTAQLQTPYLDPTGQPVTTQSRRKNIYSVAVRMEATRGLKVGTNQPDASTQPNNATVPWTNLKEIKERGATITAGSAIPLFTGDHFINLPASWNEYGQVAIEQDYPLPANILAVVSYWQPGDTPG